jgi:hypothetical protein
MSIKRIVQERYVIPVVCMPGIIQEIINIWLPAPLGIEIVFPTASAKFAYLLQLFFCDLGHGINRIKYKMIIRKDSDTYGEASLWDCFFLTAIHQNTDSYIQSH